MKYHYIYVDQARYSTTIVAKNLDTSIVNAGKKLYKTTLPSDMIFTKDYTTTSDEKSEKLAREFNIHYKACIGSFIYIFSTRVDLSFQCTS